MKMNNLVGQRDRVYTLQMDQIPAKTRRIINQYIKELEKNKIHIQRAVMFGSHSKGLSHEWSDLV